MYIIVDDRDIVAGGYANGLDGRASRPRASKRVERSVKVTKESQEARRTRPGAHGGRPAWKPTFPKPNSAGAEQKQSNDQTQKREELTNYEVSSTKSVQTTSAGFLVQNLSVAVLVNRAAITAALGDKATPEAIAAQVKEVEQLVPGGRARPEARRRRQDLGGRLRRREPRSGAGAGPSILELVARQTGTFVNAGAIVLVAAMLVWFGLRPGFRMLLAPPPGAGDRLRRGAGARPARSVANLLIESEPRDEFLQALLARRDNGPERKLIKLVDFDEGQAAAILTQSIRQGAEG